MSWGQSVRKAVRVSREKGEYVSKPVMSGVVVSRPLKDVSASQGLSMTRRVVWPCPACRAAEVLRPGGWENGAPRALGWAPGAGRRVQGAGTHPLGHPVGFSPWTTSCYVKLNWNVFQNCILHVKLSL